MLVKLAEIIKEADKKKYAIGAFNIFNLESAQAVVRAAKEMKSPAIVQVSETTINYAGLKTITKIVKSVAEEEARDIPIALHLDHGRSFRSIVECIQAGFSSVQIDASDLPLEENISLTKSVVNFAHQKKVWVQGEIGRVPGTHGKSDNQINSYKYTDPDEAGRFVKAAGVDTLAVAIGTTHGIMPGRINFPLLKKIRRVIDIPLVLHGASGESAASLKKSIKYGVREVNIDTELRLVFVRAMRKFLNDDFDKYDPRLVLASGREAIMAKVKEKIEQLGSADTI